MEVGNVAPTKSLPAVPFLLSNNKHENKASFVREQDKNLPGIFVTCNTFHFTFYIVTEGTSSNLL